MERLTPEEQIKERKIEDEIDIDVYNQMRFINKRERELIEYERKLFEKEQEIFKKEQEIFKKEQDQLRHLNYVHSK